jgi:hypothetical protein
MAVEDTRAKINDLVRSCTRELEQFNRIQDIVSTSSLVGTGLASVLSLAVVGPLFPLIAGTAAVAALVGKKTALDKRHALAELIVKFRDLLDPDVLAQAEQALAQSGAKKGWL